MGATKSKHSLLKIMVLICSYCLLNSMIANSAVIEVGGPNRWTDGFDYVSWAQQYTFAVGDVLVFSYSEGKHNVYDVSKATFQSCEPSNGVNAIYKSGNDEVELKEAKQYWFICTVDQHCSLGMKLGITVSPSSMNGPQTNTSTTTVTSYKNFASATHFSSGIYLVATGILSILVFIY